MLTMSKPEKSKELRKLFASTLSQRKSSSKDKSKTPTSTKKITHPLATYINNKLICTLCGIQIKSETLWNAHLNGSGHKEQLRKLREKRGTLDNKETEGAGETKKGDGIHKRKLDAIEAGMSKTEHVITGSGEANTSTNSTIKNSNDGSNNIAATNASIGSSTAYDEDDRNNLSSDEDQPQEKRARLALSESMTLDADTPAQLPSDFFDDTSTTAQAVSEMSITSESTSQPSKDADNSLPADFFDASKNDPAPTTVDESEWQLFQKLITKETEVSNEIADADEEELQRDRDEMQEREHDM